MDLRTTQLKDTYGNLVTTGTSEGAPTTGGLQNGQGTLLTGVGINTNSPSAKLTIETGGDEGIRIYRSGTNANFGGIEFRDSTDSSTNARLGWNGTQLRVEATGTLSMFTNSDEKLRIEADGDIAFYDDANNQGLFWDASTARLGLGTTSPNHQLEIYGGSGAGSYNLFRGFSYNGTTNKRVEININNTESDPIAIWNTTRSGGAVVEHSFQIDSSEKMRIDSSGNVGIGISPSGAKLDVLGNLRVRRDVASTQYTEILSGGGESSIIAKNNAAASFQALVFESGNNATTTERMRIDSSGNVGIGTDSPTSISGYTGATLDNSTNGGFIDLQSNGATSFRFLTNGSVNNIETRTATPIVFLTNTTERMRILPGGGLTFNGDTATANALDDYEEGTHQATITCNTSGTITLASTRDLLSYTKIGRMMFVTGELDVSAVSSPTGSFNISLPTTVASVSEEATRAVGTILITNTSTNADNFVVRCDNGNDFVTVEKGGASAPTSDSADTFSGDEFITLTFTYVSA